MNTITQVKNAGIRGRKPKLVKMISTFITKHGARLCVSDIDTAIASLRDLRKQNQGNSPDVAVDMSQMPQQAAPVSAGQIEIVAEQQPESEAVNAPNTAMKLD